MADYYIRSQEDNDSRGPFDLPKLQTLAEAGQVDENTLFYDDDREEWVKLGSNEELRAAVFPKREKLRLNARKAEEQAKAKAEAAAGEESIQVEALLEAAKGNTEERGDVKRKEKSFQLAMAIATTGIGLAAILSAIALIMPHASIIQSALGDASYATIFNYPFLVVGLFDLFLAVLLFLSVTEIYPLVRGRAMLTLGFGSYVGWALGDPMLAATAAAAGLGFFGATLAQGLPSMIPALVLGIGGHGFLAYLALTDRFKGFFDAFAFSWFGT